jgi:arylsulfatase A-like enzyme
MITESIIRQRPNILLLYTDQQRWDALGAAGNPDIHTPHLDRLATEGTLFSHHFVQNPVCMPSRASFLSGQYPETIGISHMGVILPEDIQLLPHYLAPYGYRTANIGKLHALPHANRDHREPHPSYGFDQIEISDEPGPYEDAYRAWVRARAPEHLDSISVGLPPSAVTWRRTMGVVEEVTHPEERFPKRMIPFPAPAELTHSAFVAARTRAFIDQQVGAPWLCIAGFYSPHSPWVVPQQFLDLYDPSSITLPSANARRPFQPTAGNRDSADAAGSDDELRSAIHGYYAMVSEVDHYVGQIIDHLAYRDLLDITMIVFTSDHGEWLGKYGRYGKGHPADDAVSRVPLLMRPPSSAGATEPLISTIVEAVDVLPTILETAMIPIPPTLQGTSLWPLMRGHISSHPDSAITEHHGWKTLRTAHYRYLVEASGQEHLFHLDSDPDEQRDFSGDSEHVTALAEHRHRLLQRLISRERPRPRTWTY